MATARQHRKPSVPKVEKEAEKVARQMYTALTQEGAPEATPTGYLMGTAMVMKMLLDQAGRQGADREALRKQAMAYIGTL